MSKARDWANPEYLLQGNPVQRKTYKILQELKILEHLEEYDPLVVGTIPIDIQIETSDIDVICEVHHFSAFEQRITDVYSKEKNFRCISKVIGEVPRITANFYYKGMEIEIFGQPVPTREQNGFKHMLIEDRMLRLAGETAREEIRNLKRRGLKTEPAFAQFFRLEGDPYDALLELFPLTDQELKGVLA